MLCIQESTIGIVALRRGMLTMDFGAASAGTITWRLGRTLFRLFLELEHTSRFLRMVLGCPASLEREVLRTRTPAN